MEEAYSSDVTVVVTKRNLSTTDLSLPYSMSMSLQFFLHRKKLCEGPRRCRALEALLESTDNTGNTNDGNFRPRIDIDLQDEEFDCFPRLIEYVYTGKSIDETALGSYAAMKKLASRFGVDISQGQPEIVESCEAAASKKRKHDECSGNGDAQAQDATAEENAGKDLSRHRIKGGDPNESVKETLSDLSSLLHKLKEDGGNKEMMERVAKLLYNSRAEDVVLVPGTEWLLVEILDR